MTQRIIETLIGRLVTDERFRAGFLERPEQTLTELRDRGLDVTLAEIAALVSTDPTVWTRTADDIDRRLQKVNLINDAD